MFVLVAEISYYYIKYIYEAIRNYMLCA